MTTKSEFLQKIESFVLILFILISFVSLLNSAWVTNATPVNNTTASENVDVNVPEGGSLPFIQIDTTRNSSQPPITVENSTIRANDLGGRTTLNPYPNSIIIDFENLSDSTSVFDQYADKGIIFNSPTVPSYRLFPDFAHSGIKAIEQCSGAEFTCTKPIEMTFTSPQKRVKVWVGYSDQLTESREVLLRAQGTHGIEVGRAMVTLNPSPTHQPINIPLEVTLSDSIIRSAIVSFSKTSTSMKGLVLDDVEFDTPGPSPVCTINYNPILQLYEPQDRKNTLVNKFELEGRFDNGPLNSVIMKVIGPDNQTRQSDLMDLPAMGSLREVRGFIVRSFVDLLFPGTNTVQLELKNCNGWSNTVNRTVTFMPIPKDTRIIFMGMDVTQGNFIYDSTHQLLPDTPTAIRVYLQVVGPLNELPNVRGSVLAYRPAQARPWLDLGEQLSPEHARSINSITVDSLASMSDDQKRMEDSLNFNLPQEWTRSEGEIHFEFEFYIEESPENKVRIECDVLKPNLGALQCGNLDVYGYIDFIIFKKPPCIRSENGRCLLIEGGGSGQHIEGTPNQFDPWSGGNPPLSPETQRKIEEYKKELCSPGNPYRLPEVRCPEVSYCKGAIKWSIFRTCTEIYPEWYTVGGQTNTESDQQSITDEGQRVIDEFLRECADDLTYRRDQGLISESEYAEVREIMCSHIPQTVAEAGGPSDEEEPICNPDTCPNYRLFLTQLTPSGPNNGDGYYTTHMPEMGQYGQQFTIDALLRIAREWARTHPDGPEIGINSISLPFGGPFPPHVSHQTGRDVDIRPMRSDGTEGSVRWNDQDYSQALTRDLINIIRANANVELLLFNDSKLINEGLVRFTSGHDNHLHVRFAYFP